MNEDPYKLILRAIEGQSQLIMDLAEEVKKLKGDDQQIKTSQRADRKRDWRIIKMLKGGR